MTDFKNLRDIFEMAEVLSNEYEDTLEIETVNTSTDEVVTVLFKFNQFNELESVTVEDI